MNARDTEITEPARRSPLYEVHVALGAKALPRPQIGERPLEVLSELFLIVH